MKIYNSLAEKFPDLIKEWSDRNGELSPADISYGSNKVVWWHGSCGHEWQAKVKARTTKEEGCPYCAGKRILIGFNDLATVHPELIGEWSGRNGDLRIEDVTAGSQKKVWWHGTCGHEWKATVKNRANGSTCPYCSSKIVKTGVNDLATLRPDIAEEWSEKNYPVTAEDVMPNTNKKYWWKCRKGHEWKALVSSRNKGTKCPFCSGIELLAGFNDLASTHPHLAEEWSEKNELLPSMVNAKSRKSVIWQCRKCGYEWSTAIYKRARGGGCPECKREQMIRENLIRERTVELKESFEFAYPWILLKHLFAELGIRFIEDDTDRIGAKLQFYLPDHNVAVEIMGCKQMERFSLRREIVKNRLCRKNNITMIRIIEEKGEEFDGCICIHRDDMSSESLDEAYTVLFRLIGIDMEIDSGMIAPLLFKKYIAGNIKA